MVKVSLPSSFDRGSFGLEHPGTFHLFVVAADEYPTNRDGTAVAGWRITCGVLAGTEKREIGKELQLTLRHPSGTHKDGGDFCQRMQGRFLLAIGLVSEDQAGQDIEINLEQQAPGRQLVAKFTVQPTEKNKDRVDLDGANMWHVDDPYVADIPKDESNLKQLPEELRLKKSAAKPKRASSQKTRKAAPEAAGTTEYSEPITAASEVNYDDL